jgi:hypothetical protein
MEEIREKAENRRSRFIGDGCWQTDDVGVGNVGAGYAGDGVTS